MVVEVLTEWEKLNKTGDTSTTAGEIITTSVLGDMEARVMDKLETILSRVVNLKSIQPFSNNSAEIGEPDTYKEMILEAQAEIIRLEDLNRDVMHSIAKVRVVVRVKFMFRINNTLTLTLTTTQTT
jgi:hypothetical protein